jgi:pimeloyl-ACP methyl ester carboxylesterase
MMKNGWKDKRLSVNGISIHVVEAGEADQPLLILLHGFPEFWWGWRNQITPFAIAGYHVIVPDLRGYNQSDAPQEISAYQLEVLVSDVIAIADYYGAERFCLIGHDWGGVIAWGVGASFGERLNRLVVMDAPHPDTWALDALSHPTQLMKSTYVALFQLPWLPEAALSIFDYAGLRTMVETSARPGTFSAEEMDRYTDAWANPGTIKAMLNFYRALGKRKKPDLPARISCKTLIVWGENDTFLEHHIATAALKLCDNGRLIIIPNATHWLHLEEPVRVNMETVNFLRTND